MKLNDTANKILDLAEGLTQTRGFNAFSYRDIQQEAGIKTSSIHYYFPSKHDLAEKMVERYLETFKAKLKKIEQRKISSRSHLEALGELFISTVKKGKFCLCGMLAADIISMPPTVKNCLQKFFSTSEEWIAKRIHEGIKLKEFKKSVHPEQAASHFLATLEGGMLIARTHQKTEYLKAVTKSALDGLSI